VEHVLAQKIIVRQQNYCKSVTYLTASLSYQDLGHRRTETSTPLEVTRLLTVLLKLKLKLKTNL